MYVSGMVTVVKRASCPLRSLPGINQDGMSGSGSPAVSYWPLPQGKKESCWELRELDFAYCQFASCCLASVGSRMNQSTARSDIVAQSVCEWLEQENKKYLRSP